MSVAKEAYEKLKNALMEAPMLAISNDNAQFEIYTDASAVGLGAMLAEGAKVVVLS